MDKISCVVIKLVACVICTNCMHNIVTHIFKLLLFGILFTFIDIDECLTENQCDTDANCTNTMGSYNCKCKSGYAGNGTYCNGNDGIIHFVLCKVICISEQNRQFPMFNLIISLSETNRYHCLDK